MESIEVAVKFLKLLEEAEQKFFSCGAHPEGAVVVAPFESELLIGTYTCQISFQAEVSIIRQQTITEGQ